MPDQGAVAIFAKGGTGKSLLALWLAVGLATGRGLTGPVEPIEVLYLDYEMTIRDVVERLEDMGYDDPEALGRLHYASLPSLDPLDSETGGRAIVDMAQHLKVKLVVVDTFSRAVRGEENEADIARCANSGTAGPGSCSRLQGVGFLRIDHAGKDAKKGQRGTSAKNDDVDVVWEMVERGHGEYLLRATKRRVSWVDQQVVLQRTEVDGILGYRWDDGGVTQGSAARRRVADLLDEPRAWRWTSRAARRWRCMRANGRWQGGTDVVNDAPGFRRDKAAEVVLSPSGPPRDRGPEVVLSPDRTNAKHPARDHPRTTQDHFRTQGVLGGQPLKGGSPGPGWPRPAGRPERRAVLGMASSSPWPALVAGLRHDRIVHDDGSPYLDRYHVVEAPTGQVRLHHWRTGDDQRAPHDHPWASTTLVLEGRLVEYTAAGATAGAG